MLQQIFSYSAINQIPIKISSWNFQHLFITSLCQIDKKILVPTQSACQPRPISAKTLNVSSNHICWDILKRKKLGGFQTISNDWLEGIFDILKKTAFWNFLIELWVHPNAVHAYSNMKINFKKIWPSFMLKNCRWKLEFSNFEEIRRNWKK